MPRRFDVDITLILEDQIWRISRHFHVLFWCNFADRKIDVVSTYFFRRNFTDQKIHFVSMYFFRRNFDGRKIHVASTYFFDVISMLEKSTLFPRAFFDIISLVEVYAGFPANPKNKIPWYPWFPWPIPWCKISKKSVFASFNYGNKDTVLIKILNSQSQVW